MSENFKGIFRAFSKVIGWAVTIGGYAGAYVVVFAMLITSYDVVARYAFNAPTLFAYDMSRYAFFYATLLAAPWVLRKEGHVRIDFVLLLIKNERRRALLEFFTSLLIILACAVLFYQGVISTAEDFAGRIRTDAALRIPRFLMFMAIPVSAFLLICQAIIRAKANFDRATKADNKR